MKWVRVLGAALALLLAACFLLGSGSRQSARKSLAQASLVPSPLVQTHVSSAPKLFGRASKSKPDAKALLANLPLIFEPNQGQADSGVKFVSHGSGYSLYLDPTGAMLAMQTAQPISSDKARSGRSLNSVRMTSVRMSLVGANPSATVAGSDPLPGKSNYFIGNDPKKWYTGIPQFAGVHYQSVYPGIDLVFYGSQGHLEYDFKVAPGADPSQAELQFDGESKLELAGGDLILKGGGADVRLQAPRIYQRSAGRQMPVEGHFVLRAANRVGFEIGAYDRSRELVIDPTISYSTYFGGNNAESIPSIAVNGNGNIYLAGSTNSASGIIPTGYTTAYQGTLPGVQNIFVAELNPSLGAAGLVAVTYLGGSGTDSLAGSETVGNSSGLAVDGAGNAYVAGTTTSTNFPIKSGFQSAPEASSTGTSHIFVSVLNPTFSALNYSTYLSGNGTDVATAIAIDNNSDAFVTGTTTSTDVATGFPSSSLPVPFQQQPAPSSTIQFFVTEVNTKLSGINSIPYSTYFGGNNGTIAVGGGIAVDTTGIIYFSGTTNFYNSGEGTGGTGELTTGDFPILNAYQPCLNTPPPTIVVPPVTCSAVTTPEPTDGFVAKLNPAAAQTNAAQLLFSSYFGGANADSSTALTIDTTASSIYITGSTQSPDFVIPTGAGEFQPCLNAPTATLPCSTTPNITNTDAYVAKFSNPTEASGTTTTQLTLSYFSYVGGSLNDSGLAIAVDTGAGALLTGATNSTDFPAVTATGSTPIQSHLAGAQNAFFAHIDTTTNSSTSTVGSYATYFGGTGTDRGTSITVDPSLNVYFAGDTTSPTGTLEIINPYQSALNGTMDAFAVLLRPASDLCISCVAPILAPATGAVGAGNPVTITFTVSNNGPDLATNITVNAQLSTNTAATFTTSSAGSGSICSTPTGNTAVCLIPTLQSGATASVAFAVTPTTAGTGQVTATATSSNNTNPATSTSASFTATTYGVSILPSSQTVVAGDVATYSVLVSPTQTFGNNVSLTCSGTIPVGASCGFAPATLNFNGPSSQSSTLSLTTTERPPNTISSLQPHGLRYAFWLMLPGAALVGLGGKKRRRNRLLGLLMLLALFASIVPLPACSKAKQIPTTSGTPAGTYTLQVTATSGTFTRSQGFSLTVQ
ncbi:MAG: SBBP repeat-containing protein [Candidatus Sulfotelmatobacter sp.]